MISHDVVEQFLGSCEALGTEVYGRRQTADPRMARAGFERFTSEYSDQCDGWLGLAAAGVVTREVVENAYRTLGTCGALMSSHDVGADAVDFKYNTGLYVELTARGADGITLACAALRAADSDYAGARKLIDDRVLSARPLEATWVLAVIYFRTQRWHDVRRVLAPLSAQVQADAVLRQAITVAHGISAAYLGLWQQGFDLLTAHVQGPVPAATAEGMLTAGLCARALGMSEAATALLSDAYAVADIDDSVRVTIATALSDPEYGIHPTSAARIDARTDYWDPATEPGERDFARALGAERRAELKAEATRELGEFVGMADVKDQIARLESNVRAAKQRAALGLPVRNKSLHLVLKGPPGVGKTTIARVIGKLLCAAEVLPSDTFVEASRADLVDRVIGGSEGKVKAIIARIVDAGGGVLFIDEAYALTDSKSENDFGPLVIAELMRAMVDYSEILMVIAAGYADKMDEFLDSNEGLRSRFGRQIELPSYTVDELVEISVGKATAGGSLLEATEPLTEVYAGLFGGTAVDTSGRRRPALDVLGNARFCDTLIAFAEEERDHRLDISGLLGPDATVHDLQMITCDDVRTAAARLLDKEKDKINLRSGGSER